MNLHKRAHALKWCIGVGLAAGLLLPSWAIRGGDDGEAGARFSRREPAAQARLTAEQRAAARQAENEGFDVSMRPGWSTRVSIRGAELGKRHGFSGGQGLRLKGGGAYEEDAVSVLDNLSSVMGIRRADNEFLPRKATRDRLGYHRVRVDQLHEGLRVVGADLLVHFDETDDAYQVNGSYVPGIGVNTVPVFDADIALQIVLLDIEGMGLSVDHVQGSPELVVYALECAPVLAYEIEVATLPGENQVPGVWRYWIGAESGDVITRFNDVKDISPPTSNGEHRTIFGSVLGGEGGGYENVEGWYDTTYISYYLYNKNRDWHVYNDSSDGGAYPDANTYAFRETSDWDDPDPDRMEMSCAINLDATQAYFTDVHGRNSYNNSGANIRAYVHYGNNYDGAHYSGGTLYFGDGGEGYWADFLPSAVLDVVAHEFTHGVTEYSADLFYYYESGALNESFSDIFATCIEFATQPDGTGAYPNSQDGRADWLIGEDCWDGGGAALRDMSSPHNIQTLGPDGAYQPSRYFGTHWYTGDGDNGGVHYNSGVQNFFFYLLCEGGSDNNDGIAYNISGIGMDAAEDMAYRALTVYCTSYTDYFAVRNAWMDAANDLDDSGAWAAVVDAAWRACGIGPVEISPNASAVFEGDQGGIFLPWRQTYTLTNYSESAVSWTLSNSESWLRVLPTNGTIAVGGSATIELTLTDDVKALAQDIYHDTIDIVSSTGYLLGSRLVEVWVSQPDYFAEQYGSYGDNFDLDGLSLTFTPDGSASWYSADAVPINALPVDPSSHTLIPGLDRYGRAAQIDIDYGNTVRLYENNYSTFFVGSSGYITFGTGDGEWWDTFDDHFDLPRISAFFDLLNPVYGGSGNVRWKQLADSMVITWVDVPEYYSYGSNTFQVEMFFDGPIRISWYGMTASDGLVGLSRDGSGTPEYFRETDLSGFGWDYDGDTIPNWWEADYFGGNTNCIPELDFDGDGHSNLEEYIAGMHPKNPDSVFQVTSQSSHQEAGEDRFVLSWDVVEGREYSIWRGDNLWLDLDEEMASGLSYPVNSYTDAVEAAGDRNYYKIEVKLVE